MWTSLLSIVVIINELMASNAGTIISPATNFDSWIELYNPSDQAVNLSGMYLSDDAENLKRWQMPNDIGTIPAKGFKVIWLGSNDIKTTQAPFKLDCDGGSIYLSDKDGQLITSETYPEAMSRTAYARTTDGGNQWGWTADVTPEATNTTSVFANERLAPPVVSQGSTLFSNSLSVKVDIPEGTRLMYTTNGSLPQKPKDPTPDDPKEPKEKWVQMIRNGDCEGEDATCFVCRDGDGSGDIPRITDGVGVNNSRGIKVHAIANPQNDWDSQFFIYVPDYTLYAGDKYRFSMTIRADKASHFSVQSHQTPSIYIHWQMLANNYNVTTEWKTITYEGEVTEIQAGESGFQAIAFNLNEKAEENNFYFDNISWELYYNEENHPSTSSLESKDGLFDISKTTNLTLRLFKDGYLPSVPVTRSYIKTNNQYSLPIISIVGDKTFFTDPKIGFDCDGDGTNGTTGNGQDTPKNYNMEWDRPVNFSYISSNGEMLFNQDVNISVSGGWTRSQRFRSFKLKANKIFDGQNRFDYSFFPQKPYIRDKAVLVRNGGNDVWNNGARFTDPALATIIQRSGIDIDVQSYVPVIEYVNGALRGVFNLRETTNDKFVYANWGYDDDEIDMFENFIMNQGNDSIIKRIFNLGKHINDTGAYDELKTLLDIDEYANYMAAELYLLNSDWPHNNVKAYRTRDNGRYRFICFDLDYVFGSIDSSIPQNPFDYITKHHQDEDFVLFFKNMMNHETFRKKFINIFSIMGGSVFEASRAYNIIDELADNVRPMTQLMQQAGISDGHDVDRAVNFLKNNLNGRTESMADYMKQSSILKLSNVAKTAVILSADTEGASLLINGITVPYSYFNGYLFGRAKLEAKAPAGYKFKCWEKNGSQFSTSPTISVASGSSVTMIACFTPLTTEEQTAEGFIPVRINEASASNNIYINDYFKRNDWIELYNNTTEPVDVAGMYITDNIEKPQKYQIAGAQTIIPAHGHLVIWCDKLEPISQLHAQFKLAAEGGTLMLTAADLSWSDRLTYVQHRGNETVGRYPDGANDVFVMNVPTIEKQNLASSYLAAVEQPVITGIDDMSIQTIARQQQVVYYNLSGQPVSQPERGGCYIARITDSQGHTKTIKFIKK